MEFIFHVIGVRLQHHLFVLLVLDRHVQLFFDGVELRSGLFDLPFARVVSRREVSLLVFQLCPLLKLGF